VSGGGYSLRVGN